MLKPLTSLRFFFACMVFVSHLNFLVKSEPNFLSITYNSVFKEGYIGVSFFFILSGFILAYNYQEGILKRQKSIQAFYQARFARIFPIHLLTFIISVPLSYKLFLEDISLWTFQAFTNITLTQSFIPLKRIYFSFNAPSWSISNEMFFYLAFPFLILLLSRIKKLKNFVIVAIIAGIPLLTLLIAENYYHQLFYISPFIRIVDFIIGILIFSLYKRFLEKKRNINFDLVEVIAIILLLIFFFFHSWIPQVARYSFYYWIPMSFLIFSFSFQAGMISKFLSGEFLIYLGEISFGFYMFHLLVLRYFSVINSKFFQIENDILIIAITFFITLIISHASFMWFERPMNNLIRNHFRKRVTCS